MQKKSQIIRIVFLLILTTSCNFKKNEFGAKDSQLDNDYALEIELQYKISNDDIFEVYYTNSDKENFSSKKILRNKVFGSKNYKKVSFQFPKGEFPNKIRLDLGENRKQNCVRIKNIKIKYREKEIIISRQLLPHFFVTNKYLEYNSSNGVFRSSIVNNGYDPFITSSALLRQKIKLEF